MNEVSLSPLAIMRTIYSMVNQRARIRMGYADRVSDCLADAVRHDKTAQVQQYLVGSACEKWVTCKHCLVCCFAFNVLLVVVECECCHVYIYAKSVPCNLGSFVVLGTCS